MSSSKKSRTKVANSFCFANRESAQKKAGIAAGGNSIRGVNEGKGLMEGGQKRRGSETLRREREVSSEASKGYRFHSDLQLTTTPKNTHFIKKPLINGTKEIQALKLRGY